MRNSQKHWECRRELGGVDSLGRDAQQVLLARFLDQFDDRIGVQVGVVDALLQHLDVDVAEGRGQVHEALQPTRSLRLSLAGKELAPWSLHGEDRLTIDVWLKD